MSSYSSRVFAGNLIETLDHEGLVYPKASFADLFIEQKNYFKIQFLGVFKKLMWQLLFFSQETNVNISTKSIFSSKHVTEQMQKSY